MKDYAVQAKVVCRVAALFMALFTAGCSGPPSESVGRQIVEKQIQEQSKGLIELVSFRKTNAILRDNYYQLEYEVELTYTDDVRVFNSPMMAGPFYAERGRVTPTISLMMDGKRRGEGAKQTGTLEFQKTEKGWRGKDGNVY